MSTVLTTIKACVPVAPDADKLHKSPPNSELLPKKQ